MENTKISPDLFECFQEIVKSELSESNETSSDQKIYEAYFQTCLLEQDGEISAEQFTAATERINTAIIEKLYAKGYSFRKICEVMKTTEIPEEEITETIENVKQSPAIKIAFSLLMEEINKSHYHTKYEALLKAIYEEKPLEGQEELYLLYYELDFKIAKALIMHGLDKKATAEILATESVVLKNKLHKQTLAQRIVEPINLSPIILNYYSLFEKEETEQDVYQKLKNSYNGLIKMTAEAVTLNDYQKFLVSYEQLKYKILRVNQDECILRDSQNALELEEMKETLYQKLIFEDQLIADHIQCIHMIPLIETLPENATNAQIYAAYTQKTQQCEKNGVPAYWDNEIRNEEIILYLSKDGCAAEKIAEIMEESTLITLRTAAQIAADLPQLLQRKIIRDDIRLKEREAEEKRSTYEKLRLSKVKDLGEDIDLQLAIEYMSRSREKGENIETANLETLLLESPHLFMTADELSKRTKIQSIIETAKKSPAYKEVLQIRSGNSDNLSNVFMTYVGILCGFGQELKKQYEIEEIIKMAICMIHDQHKDNIILQTLCMIVPDKKNLYHGLTFEEYIKRAHNYIQKMDLTAIYQKGIFYETITEPADNEQIYAAGVHQFFEEHTGILPVIEHNNEINDKIVKWLDDKHFAAPRIVEILKHTPLKKDLNADFTTSSLIDKFQEHEDITAKKIEDKIQKFKIDGQNLVPGVTEFESVKEYRNFMYEKNLRINDYVGHEKKTDTEYIRIVRENEICKAAMVQLQQISGSCSAEVHIKGTYDLNNMTTFSLVYIQDFWRSLAAHGAIAYAPTQNQLVKENPSLNKTDPLPPVREEQKTAETAEPLKEETTLPAAPLETIIMEPEDQSPNLETVAQEPAASIEEKGVAEIEETSKEDTGVKIEAEISSQPQQSVATEKEIRNPKTDDLLNYNIQNKPLDDLKPSEKYMTIAKKLLLSNGGKWNRNIDVTAVRKLLHLRLNALLLQKLIVIYTPGTYGLTAEQEKEYMANIISDAQEEPMSDETEKILSKPATEPPFAAAAPKIKLVETKKEETPANAPVSLPVEKKEETNGFVPTNSEKPVIEDTAPPVQGQENLNTKEEYPEPSDPVKEPLPAEENLNLEQILHFSTDKHRLAELDTDEKYLCLAQKFYQKKGTWEDGYDLKIAQQMLLASVPTEIVKSTILLNSPSIPQASLDERNARAATIIKEALYNAKNNMAEKSEEIEAAEEAQECSITAEGDEDEGKTKIFGKEEDLNIIKEEKETTQKDHEGIQDLMAKELPKKDYLELTDTQKYMYIAQNLIRKNGSWKDAFDFEIADRLHREGITILFIERILSNCSPATYKRSPLEKESYAKEILKAI